MAWIPLHLSAPGILPFSSIATFTAVLRSFRQRGLSNGSYADLHRAECGPGPRSLSTCSAFRALPSQPFFPRRSAWSLCWSTWRGKSCLLFICRPFSGEAVSAFLQKGSRPLFSRASSPQHGFLASLVSGYGVTAIAAYGIIGKLETILFYPAMALNMVLTTIVGQCAGNAFDRARDYLNAALLYGGGLCSFFPRWLWGLPGRFHRGFCSAHQQRQSCNIPFYIVGIGYVLNTVTNCFLGAVNGMGRQ